MKFISLFAGPGGMCLGAEMTGQESVGIEWDANACQTRRAAGLTTIQGDVRKYGPSDFPDCDALMGGPPCQTFSVAGSGSGRKSLDDVLTLAQLMEAGADVGELLTLVEDEKTALVLEPLRWILERHRAGSQYKAILLEQVPTVLPVWNEYARILRGIGYDVTTSLVNAEEYGVPQTRKRAVLLARPFDLMDPVEIPTPTHCKYRKGQSAGAAGGHLKPWVSLGEVVDRGTPYWVRSNYNTASTGQRARRSSFDPAFTVTGCVMRNRFFAESDDVELDRVSYGEAGAIQTFPIDYPWSGRYIHQQIGNAAPPVLMAALLRGLVGTA